MKPLTFPRAEAFRRWLEQHHATASDVLVAFHRKHSGRGGLTYAEALDDALCFGWIDGVRKGLDENRYTIRFSPRKPRSIWSRVNIAHVERLTKAGRMHPAGLAAFAARTNARSGVYSFENRPAELPPALAKIFRQEPRAWAFFQQQPPGYRKTTTWWVVSAKQDATQQRRLARLIGESAAGRRLDLMAPYGRG